MNGVQSPHPGLERQKKTDGGLASFVPRARAPWLEISTARRAFTATARRISNKERRIANDEGSGMKGSGA
jgi:hypothetical protein